ncbi:hypothetical protein KUTeg_000443 [Tegillarca granosa]|uniref:Tumor protein D54 n=1 Tax=Tegillarca granosa TaxID=220873 RepID=A0ABQ9G0Z7_TEGGR|nr:hypothetical protein KUTeg_000443 [Tegillarca granosa]
MNKQNSVETQDDLEYTPKISNSANYLKFLQLVHDGGHSDDENMSHGDMEDMIGGISSAESDLVLRSNELTEADEHLYDNMNSPTFEDVPKDSEAKADNEMNEADRQKQIDEWKEELQRVTNMSFHGSGCQRTSPEVKRYVKTNEKIHEINDKITHSSAYQKTSSTLKTAGEKTNAAVSSLGASVSKKMGEIRNSQTFKSMEEKVGDVYANVKTSRSIENIKGRFGLAKVTGSKSDGNIDEALQSDSPKTEQPETLPEEKVPL